MLVQVCVCVCGGRGKVGSGNPGSKAGRNSILYTMGGTCRKEERARIDVPKAFGTGAMLEKISARLHKILQKK